MGNENGEWIMYGVREDDPSCLHTPEELLAYVNRVGFLPLFKNGIPGFSVEEHTVSRYWWSEDEIRDPWCWRQILAGSEKIAYGKFFCKKAGFISLDWLPVFANARRNGYDFDARWDDALASYRSKRIMDQFEGNDELFSFALKQRAGFGKDGEKNFEGTVTDLQMQTYLVIRDFRSRLNRQGLPYGWKIAVYAKPETLWGYDFVTGCYREDPSVSQERIFRQMQAQFPDVPEKLLRNALQ